jgi:hypothetical protein
MGEGDRITTDLGLSAIGLLGVVIVALVGTGLVHKELERRTIHVVLSRPVSRAVLPGGQVGRARGHDGRRGLRHGRDPGRGLGDDCAAPGRSAR